MANNFKFQLGTEVFNKSFSPFFIGKILANYVDDNKNYCVLRSLGGNLYIALEENLERTKEPLTFAYERGLGKIVDDPE